MQKLCTSSTVFLRRLTALLFLVALAAFVEHGKLAGFDNSTDLSQVSSARILLRELYPELSGKGYGGRLILDGSYDAEMSLRNFALVVWKAKRILNTDKDVPPPSLPLPEERILTASFEFDSRGVINSLHVSSPEIVHDTRNEDLRRTVDQHQKWTDAQVEKALRDGGAKYAPQERDALLRAIPREALEPQLGRYKVESAEFRMRHRQPSGNLAELYWEVSVASEVRDGRRLAWSMNFEPFDGRLTSIIRDMTDR